MHTVVSATVKLKGHCPSSRIWEWVLTVKEYVHGVGDARARTRWIFREARRVDQFDSLVPKIPAACGIVENGAADAHTGQTNEQGALKFGEPAGRRGRGRGMRAHWGRRELSAPEAALG